MALKDLIISSFPKYCETLISGRSVTFRPMIVLEEKSLLIAKQSGDRQAILKTLIDILTACFDIKDINEFSIPEIEHAFLLLRAKSISEIDGFTIRCPVTNELVEFSLNIMIDLLTYKSELDSKIKLNNNLLLVMSPPTVEILLKYPNYKEDETLIYPFIASCIKQIHTKKEVIECSEKPHKEIVEFVQHLTSDQFNSIINYFDNISIVYFKPEYITKDGIKRNVVIKGIFSFIDFFFNHLTLKTLYIQNFQMKYHHKYSLTEIENMIPWERSIYLEQIKSYLAQENNREMSH